AEELGFDERFGLLVDAEEAHRENKRFQRALNEAKLKIGQACVEGIDYPPKRTLDKAVIRQLAGCRWTTEAHHILKRPLISDRRYQRTGAVRARPDRSGS